MPLPWEVAENFQMNGLPCFFDNSWMRKHIYWFLNSELGPSDQITLVPTCWLDGMKSLYNILSNKPVENLSFPL